MNIPLRILIAIAALLAGPVSAQAQAAGPKRPANVPESYVITPFGYFHPSCVVHLAEGDEIRRDQTLVRHADGTTAAMHVCEYARYKADGESMFGDERAIAHPDINGYIELVSAVTKTSYGSLSAQWSVPARPHADDGQTIYIFPGLEDTQNTVTILQPVLGWNSDYPSAWGIASWNCCESGTVYEAPSARVSPGDTIFGQIHETCAAGTASCASWNVLTQDLRTGKSSALTNTSSFGQTFNWAFAGALEVYGVSRCADYPTTDAFAGGNTVSMNSLIVSDVNLVPLASPAWKVSKTPAGATPNCNYGAAVTKEIILNN